MSVSGRIAATIGPSAIARRIGQSRRTDILRPDLVPVAPRNSGRGKWDRLSQIDFRGAAAFEENSGAVL